MSWSYWTPLEAPLAVNVEELYTRYGPMVYRRCKALLKDDQAAEELMQETFIQILRRQDVLEVHAPSSMLYRTATNLCLNRIRAKGRRPEDPDDELVMRIASAPDSGGVSEARSVLARIFSTQKESTRTMATLLLLDGRLRRCHRLWLDHHRADGKATLRQPARLRHQQGAGTSGRGRPLPRS